MLAARIGLMALGLAPPSAEASPDPGARDVPSRVLVEVVEKEGRALDLFRERPLPKDPGRNTGVEAVCALPCTFSFMPSAGERFLVGAPGYAVSRRFRLDGRGESLRVEVRAGRYAVLASGVVLAILGGGAALSGSMHPRFADPGNSRLSLALLAGGGVLLAASVPLLVFGSTRVRVVAGR